MIRIRFGVTVIAIITFKVRVRVRITELQLRLRLRIYKETLMIAYKEIANVQLIQNNTITVLITSTL